MSTHSSSSSSTIKKARVELQQLSASVSTLFPASTRQANKPPANVDLFPDKIGASSNCTSSEKEAAHRPQCFSGGLHLSNRVVALQKLVFFGLERPFEIIDLLRERGITGERLSEHTRDNAFDLGSENAVNPTPVLKLLCARLLRLNTVKPTPVLKLLCASNHSLRLKPSREL